MYTATATATATTITGGAGGGGDCGVSITSGCHSLKGDGSTGTETISVGATTMNFTSTTTTTTTTTTVISEKNEKRKKDDDDNGEEEKEEGADKNNNRKSKINKIHNGNERDGHQNNDNQQSEGEVVTTRLMIWAVAVAVTTRIQQEAMTKTMRRRMRSSRN